MDREWDGGFRLGYRPELDGLRALAVLTVMAFHSDPWHVPGGFLGVDVFFVLSGFLITVLLVQEHRQSGAVHLPRFYLRRALRLFPALFVMLAVCCVTAALRLNAHRAGTIGWAALVTACYGANWDWLWPLHLDLFGHAWSLSVEEQFYLLWPIVLCVLLRRGVGLRRIGQLVALGIAASVLFRAVVWTTAGTSAAQVQAATVSLACRADSLLAGCFVGLVVVAGRLPRSHTGRMALQMLAGASAVLLIGMGVAVAAKTPCLYLGGYAAAAVATALIVAALLNTPSHPVGRFLAAPVLVWIGRISYGLYLWHVPMLALVPKLLHGILPAARYVPGLDQLLACVAAFGAATLSYYWVERPFLSWKARLGSAAPAAPAVIFARSSRRSGPGIPAASSGRAGCPA